MNYGIITEVREFRELQDELTRCRRCEQCEHSKDGDCYRQCLDSYLQRVVAVLNGEETT